MSFSKRALPALLVILPLLGVGCSVRSLFPVSHTASSTVVLPASTSTMEGVSAVTSTEDAPIAGAVGQITAYRGGFIDGQETIVWMTKHQTLPEYPGTFAGRFSEVKTGRSGVIIQDPIDATSSVAGDSFTFVVKLDSMKEDESITGHAIHVTRSDEGEFYHGVVNVQGKDQEFTLARAPGFPSFDLIQFNTSTTARVGACEYSVRYPQIHQADFLTDPQKNTINTKIVQLVQMGTSTFAEQATEFIETCQSELKDISEMDGMPSSMTYVVDNSVQVSSATPHLLSLVLLNYVYSGGAHGTYGYEAFNLHIPSGEALTLSNLVKPEHLKEFTKLASRKLLAQNEEYLFPESVDDLKAFLKDTARLSASQQGEQYGRQGNWYLTDGGITFFYNPYEIASYAAGIQEVGLSFPSWRIMALPAALQEGLLP